MTTVKEVLQKAKTYIERGHCKGGSARNADGRTVPARFPNAAAWCVYGAVKAATETDEQEDEALTVLCNFLSIHPDNPSALFDWNDASERTQAEVVELFDRAIERCDR